MVLAQGRVGEIPNKRAATFFIYLNKRAKTINNNININSTSRSIDGVGGVCVCVMEWYKIEYRV